MNIRSLLKPVLAGLALAMTTLFSAQALAVTGCIKLVKEVSADGGMNWYDANTEAEAVTITNGANYRFTITKCDLDAVVGMVVTDDIIGVNQALDDFPIGIHDPINDVWTQSEDDTRVFVVEAPEICMGYEGTLKNTATVTGTAVHYQDFLTSSDDAWIRCEPTIKEGGEGCTPGYWKQEQHVDSWPATVTPFTTYSAVFDRIITVRINKVGLVTDPTLLQALSALGGQINTLARHSAAAYLNSASGGVSYDLTTDEIIANVQAAIDSGDLGSVIEALVSFNEQGCPLN